MPDANTIWIFCEAPTKAGAMQRLFELFDRELRAAGYLAMAGQLIDASIVAAPKQRNTRAEKQAIREGRVPEGWQAKPAKLRQKDRDARWTVKTTKARPRDVRLPEPDQRRSSPPADPPLAGYGRRRARRQAPDGPARSWQYGERRLGDTGYRSRKNEDLLRQRMLKSHIHRKKPGADRCRC